MPAVGRKTSGTRGAKKTNGQRGRDDRTTKRVGGQKSTKVTKAPRKASGKAPVKKTSGAARAGRETASAGSRLAGMDRVLVATATETLSRNNALVKLMREGVYENPGEFVLRVGKLIEVELRRKLRVVGVSTLADLISQSRDRGILSEDGFHLATRIRHVRNGIAHDSVDRRTIRARGVLVAGAAILLFSEL